MINPMKGLIEKFYKAFQNKDAETMISCYHEDVVFRDPVFGELKGDDARAMWIMLCRNAKDLQIELSDISASLKKGSAHWEAWYSFSKTGRKVHNVVRCNILNLKIPKSSNIPIALIFISGHPGRWALKGGYWAEQIF